jgi:hypothetical protein
MRHRADHDRKEPQAAYGTTAQRCDTNLCDTTSAYVFVASDAGI